MNTITIGLCGACEAEVRLRKDGTLGKHKMPASGAGCPKSGYAPEKVLPLTFRRWLSTQRCYVDSDDFLEALAGRHSKGMTTSICGRGCSPFGHPGTRTSPRPDRRRTATESTL